MPVRTQQKGGRILVINTGKVEADDWFKVTTGVSGHSNNWLLLVEQAANATGKDCIVCMGPRPLLQIVPANLPPQCLLDVMNKTVPSPNCSSWDSVFPLSPVSAKKPIFLKKVAPGNFTCINLTGISRPLGCLNDSQCQYIIQVSRDFKPVARSDIWWWCGDDKLLDKMPTNVTGLCAIVTLLLPVTVLPMSAKDITNGLQSVLPTEWSRRRRDAEWLSKDDPTYIDAIGVPRGVPDEYKLADQVSAGFESSICWWCTLNKNVDRINYIHYNVQKLGNWTQAGFEAVHDQLAATSLMAFQNRIALDMLLAEKGGVCAMFGEQCCTFIPNNTAPDGTLTKAIHGLRTLNGKMKEHSGVDTTMWDFWLNMFGKYKVLVSSILVSLAVFAAILTLCGCCCIPCLCSLVNRLITTAISPMESQIAQMYPLLGNSENDSDAYDLFPDPEDYERWRPIAICT